MGAYSSKPPDYTPQHQAATEAYVAGIGKEADQYNSSVADFNKGIDKFSSKVDKLSDRIGKININNIGNFGQFDDKARDLKSSLASYRMDETAPSFDSVFSSHGMTTAIDAPTLAKADTSRISGLSNDLTSLLSTYDNIEADRQAALDADKDFRTDINAQLGSLWNQANDADIYADGSLGLLKSQFGGIQDAVAKYDSELNDAKFTGIEGGITRFGDWLSKQQGKYDAEQGRIKDYTKSLGNTILDAGDTLDNLSIADLEGIDALDATIGTTLREALNYDPRIATDLTRQVSALQGLDASVDALRDQRKAEQKRIDSAGADYSSDINNLMKRISDMGLNSGSAFDTYQRGIDDLTSSIGGFKSELATDFSDQQAGLADIQAQLDNRMAERRSAIDAITGRATDARDTGLGTDLWDEQGMRDALEAINNEVFNLNQYTGGRTADDRSLLTNAAESINQRLNQLADRRGDIETRAQDLLGEIQGAQFYGQEDVDRLRSAFDALQTESNQYGSTQSSNELADALSILTGEQNRLDRSAEELAARQAREAEQSAGQMFGIDRNYILSELENTNMTPEEYQALVSRVKEQDPEFANLIIQKYGALFGAA